MPEKKIRVLVADDEKIVRDFFSRLLSLRGLEVVCAEDGYKAVELAKEGNFELFFLDVKMPGMDGLETFRKIRQINPNAVVVMMTGYIAENILEQAQKEGAYGSIRKPFDISEIKDIVDRAGKEELKRALNVLVIDDDQAVLDFFARLLKEKNHKCKLARDKEEALGAARGEKFDLVFLDLVLKDLNGIEFYKEIKELLPEATIVVITGYPHKVKEIEGALEIAGCLYKPFEIDKVLDYLKGLKGGK